MDNYKIRVNNEDESERAQRAFFVLGGEWYNQGKVVKNYDFRFLTFYPEEGFIKREKEMDYFRESDNKEITLPELEKLAADLLTSDSSEPQYQIAAITESPKEGQKRYDAAIGWIQTNIEKLYDHNTGKNSLRLEDVQGVKQALKIAAGLPE